MNNSVFFVSDTHFKYHKSTPLERTKRKLFFRFLENIQGADRLYLVGDIFDFWFEYKSVVPSYYCDIFLHLRLLRESGTRIYIAGGNHDFWLGGFISEAMDLKILDTLETHQLQGRSITVTHGDMLMPGDIGYKILKNIIRNRAVIGFAKMIHPSALFAFARYFSSKSKGLTEGKTEYWADRMTDMAENSLYRWGNDAFIMGHIHKPVLKTFSDGRIFSILGDWEKNFSYLKLRDGAFQQGSYSEEGNTLTENR